jgi:hypothetical protein
MSTVNIFRLFQFMLVKDVSQDIRLFNKTEKLPTKVTGQLHVSNHFILRKIFNNVALTG